MNDRKQRVMNGVTFEQARGAVPVHTPAVAANAAYVGAKLAPYSGAPYVGRGNFCMAKNDTCEGRKVGGKDYCAGHQRSFEKTGERP